MRNKPKPKNKLTASPPEKRRFVRVHLDFVLDIGRDFGSAIPYELINIERNVNDVVETGLRRHLTRRSLVRLVYGCTRSSMKSATRSQLERTHRYEFTLPIVPSAPIKRTRHRAVPKRKARKKGKRA